MTVPEHFYGLLTTLCVVVLLVITLLKVWIFNWVEVTYKKEME